MQNFFRPVDLVNVQTIPIDQIQKISVSYISESIRILETEGDALVLKEYFSDPSPKYFAKILTEGDHLTIVHGARDHVFSTLRGHIELYMPKRYYGVLNVKTVSGKIEAPHRLALSELSVSNTSGKIALTDVMAGNVVLSTVSGAIDVGTLKAMADIHSTSGSIRISHAEGDGAFRTVSGSIDVSFRTVTGDLNARSTSGRVRLAVPALLSFSLEANTVSGTIHVPFNGMSAGGRRGMEVTIGDSPQVRVVVRTVSGRIEVVPL